MKQLHDSDIGRKLGTSEWISFSQEDIDTFGRVTRDEDPFHMNVEWAKQKSPFKQTIAYGFQTLSMLTYFCHEILEWPSGLDQKPDGIALNYGFDKIRFIEPVPVNKPIRCHITLTGIKKRHRGENLCHFLCEVEIKGVEKPALIANWQGLFIKDEDLNRLKTNNSDY
jgi:acyl dehydratase